MVTEVKSLDSDMQMLVYENYNKFLSATDTIRKMRDNVEMMERDMDQLTASMDAIATSSDSINAELAPSREQIERLTGIRRLVKKLQFIFELPSRLRKAIDMEAYAQAVKYYNLTERTLAAFAHLASFKAIQIDANKIIADLRAELRKRATTEGMSIQLAAEAVGLLLELPPTDGDSPEALREAFLECRLAALTRVIGGEEERARAEADGAEADADADGVAAFVASLTRTFIADFGDVARKYRQLFPTEMGALKDITRSLFARYFVLVQARLARRVWPREDLVQALETFQNDVLRSHSLIPEARLADKASEMIEKALRGHVEQVFAGLRASIVDRLRHANGLADSKTSLGDCVANTASGLTEDLGKQLAVLEPLVRSKASILAPYTRSLVGFVHRESEAMVQFVLETASGALPLPDVKVHKAFGIMMARLCLSLAKDGVARVAAVLKEKLPTQVESDRFQEKEFTARCRDVAHTCVLAFVRQTGGDIAKMMRSSIETRNWLTVKEPRDVRSSAVMIVEEVVDVYACVSQLFGDTRKPQTSANAGLSAASTTASASTFDRLFKTKLDIYGTVSFETLAIVGAVVKISLKTYLESVRMRTFSKFAYQQLEIDAFFFRTALRSYVDDATVFDGQLDEVLTSTGDRCLDPTGLEPSIIDTLVAKCRAKSGL